MEPKIGSKCATVSIQYRRVTDTQMDQIQTHIPALASHGYERGVSNRQGKADLPLLPLLGQTQRLNWGRMHGNAVPNFSATRKGNAESLIAAPKIDYQTATKTVASSRLFSSKCTKMHLQPEPHNKPSWGNLHRFYRSPR